jgi:hypothetical protein
MRSLIRSAPLLAPGVEVVYLPDEEATQRERVWEPFSLALTDLPVTDFSRISAVASSRNLPPMSWRVPRPERPRDLRLR